MRDADWDIRREGRAWVGDEARKRYELTPEKIEMVKGWRAAVRNLDAP